MAHRTSPCRSANGWQGPLCPSTSFLLCKQCEVKQGLAAWGSAARQALGNAAPAPQTIFHEQAVAGQHVHEVLLPLEVATDGQFERDGPGVLRSTQLAKEPLERKASSTKLQMPVLAVSCIVAQMDVRKSRGQDLVRVQEVLPRNGQVARIENNL